MIIAVSITKDVDFRGTKQPFANVYHYRLDTAVTAPSAEIVSEIVAMERKMHATFVRFLLGQVWSAGGSPTQNRMLYEETLTGTGDQASVSGLDVERAYLIRWPAGFDSRGKPVYLRKWYHSGGAANGISPSTAVQANVSPFTDAQRATIASHVNSVRQAPDIGVWDLCAASGRLTTGPAEAHRFLEHRQLGDKWR